MEMRLVSYSQRCPQISIRRSFCGRRRAWSVSTGSSSETVYAGFGIAAELTAWGEDRFQTIRARASDLFRDVVLLNDEADPLRARACSAASPSAATSSPRIRGRRSLPAYFVLPHYQLTQVGGETWLTINVQVGAGRSD